MPDTLNTIAVPGIELVRQLAQGSDSIVFLGRRLDRECAVKISRVGTSSGNRDAFRLRFRREAATLARIRHPGLPAIMDVGESGDRSFIVMEYVAGDTLASLFEQGPLPETELLGHAVRTLRWAPFSTVPRNRPGC